MGKGKDKKTVLVGGCFDLLHYGHFTFLKNAASAGNYLIVALEPDDFIRRKKKKNPVHTQRQRANILKALRFVDKVVMLPYLKTDDEYFKVVKKINPDIIAITDGDLNLDKKAKQAKRIGAALKVVAPLIKGFSTDEIISSDRFTRES